MTQETLKISVELNQKDVQTLLLGAIYDREVSAPLNREHELNSVIKKMHRQVITAILQSLIQITNDKASNVNELPEHLK